MTDVEHARLLAAAIRAAGLDADDAFAFNASAWSLATLAAERMIPLPQGPPSSAVQALCVAMLRDFQGMISEGLADAGPAAGARGAA